MKSDNRAIKNVPLHTNSASILKAVYSNSVHANILIFINMITITKSKAMNHIVAQIIAHPHLYRNV